MNVTSSASMMEGFSSRGVKVIFGQERYIDYVLIPLVPNPCAYFHSSGLLCTITRYPVILNITGDHS